MKHYETRSARDLDEIISRVHDRYFDLEKIVFDETQKILRIPITVIEEEITVSRNIFLIKVHTHPVCGAKLQIHMVRRFEVVDEANIGQGVINTISVEGDAVVIKCSLPVTIKATVTEFHLTLDVTDQIIEYKRYYSLI
jgi:hypothetical protein